LEYNIISHVLQVALIRCLFAVSNLLC